MSKFTTTAIAVAIGLTFSVGAMAQTMSKSDYKSGMESIAAEYKSHKTICESLSGNANDVCMAEAKGKENIAKADLEARNKNTNESRYEALVTKAEADYSVAKEKCDDQAGNTKDVCLKEAKAAEIAAKADAKSQKKISKANKKADKESAEVRKRQRMNLPMYVRMPPRINVTPTTRWRRKSVTPSQAVPRTAA
jgi:hypothetical protein